MRRYNSPFRIDACVVALIDSACYSRGRRTITLHQCLSAAYSTLVSVNKLRQCNRLPNDCSNFGGRTFIWALTSDSEREAKEFPYRDREFITVTLFTAEQKQKCSPWWSLQTVILKTHTPMRLCGSRVTRVSAILREFEHNKKLEPTLETRINC